MRQTRTWREAATRYLLEFAEQPSIWLTATYLEQMDPFIGDLPITHVDDESLAGFLGYMRKGGNLPSGKPKKPVGNRTINIALQRIVRVLNVCHRKWRDDQKRPWLDAVPAITMMDESKTSRAASPLSWDEQRVLFKELPDHLHRMALFKVNTGCREQEVCKLSWEWEVSVPELGTSVFIIPAEFGGRSENSGVKNREERVVILNDVAKSVIESQRGLHKSLVFPYNGHALHRMNDSAWRSARERAADRWEVEFGVKAHAGFRNVRIHPSSTVRGRNRRFSEGAPRNHAGFKPLFKKVV